ncbi:MAG: helix-turn-helix domain-containing protein, partial [Candidatus Rokuibacteriota bacterium]
MAREVAGIVRVLQILESLAISPDGISVRDLSRAIGCGKGTISKMLGTLER